jgi:uncharacterized protein YndB with AHSA1/START domain
MLHVSALSPPDISARPFSASTNRRMTASPEVLYRAWTEQFDSWFAIPGTVLMSALVDAPFFFETQYEGEHQPHYGRFIRLETNRLVELTWLNAGGTAGAETVVTVTLEPDQDGTRLHLSHVGFPTQKLAQRHVEAWPLVLEQLDRAYPANKGVV